MQRLRIRSRQTLNADEEDSGEIKHGIQALSHLSYICIKDHPLSMDYTLSAVRLWVSDLERAKDFYSNTIGMPVAVDDIARGYFILDTGTVKVIVEKDEPEEGESSAVGFMPYSFAVTDIHRSYTELTHKGVEFPHPPEKQFWGGTLAIFKDPDGNEMTLVEY